MKMKIDPTTHYFFTSSKEIEEIIQPLKDFFGLTSFVYQKRFLDGSEIRLSNQPKWMYHFYTTGLYQHSIFEKNMRQFQKSHIVWAGIPQHSVVLAEARQFNIDHGITFVEPSEDGCEFFFIGTRSDHPEVMAHYTSNIDLLQRFLVYFRDKAAPIIKKAHENRLTLPSSVVENSETPLIGHFDRQAFLAQIEGKPLFTPRELDCIRLLIKGYNLKMIAQELAISIRTVETHLEHIKQKSGCATKAELVRYFAKTPWTL